MKQPCYIGLEEGPSGACRNGCQAHSKRQMQRAADMDAQGRRKLPFFVDPIEHKLKIEKDDLLSRVFQNGKSKRKETCDQIK